MAMKRIYQIVCLTIVAAMFGACSGNSYSTLLREEKKTIANYIEREGIETTDTWPGYKKWPNKLYYEVPGYDNFYFHLTKCGDSTLVQDDSVYTELNPVAISDKIVLRYKQYRLTADADTIDYWTTISNAYAVEFNYLTSSSACTAWHESVRLMRFSGAECEIICPSKLGETSAQSSVTPYGYKMHILIRR